MSAIVAEKERKVSAQAAFVIEAKTPRNQDLMIQNLNGMRLRGAVQATIEVFDRNWKEEDDEDDPDEMRPVSRPAPANIIEGIGELPGERLYVNPGTGEWKTQDPLYEKKSTLERIRLAVRSYWGISVVGQKLLGMKSRKGTIGPDQMKSLCEELVCFVEAEEDVVRGKRVLLVTLKKLDKEITVQVATKKDAKGKEKTDPKLAAKIAKCKANKVVDVELGGTKRARVLVYIGEYLPPVEGIFTKLIDKSKDDPNKTAIKATVYGKTKTYFLRTTVLRGKIRVNAKMLSLAKKLKPGNLVEIKYRPYGKHQLAIRMVKLKKSKDDDL